MMVRSMREILDHVEVAIGAQDAEAFAEAERSARARFISHLIPDSVDLSQPCRVALALLDARCRSRDFADVLDDAIAFAFLRRIAEQAQWAAGRPDDA